MFLKLTVTQKYDFSLIYILKGNKQRKATASHLGYRTAASV